MLFAFKDRNRDDGAAVLHLRRIGDYPGQRYRNRERSAEDFHCHAKLPDGSQALELKTVSTPGFVLSRFHSLKMDWSHFRYNFQPPRLLSCGVLTEQVTECQLRPNQMLSSPTRTCQGTIHVTGRK